MPRIPTELSEICPYHICARSNNKEWFQLPLDQVWRIYREVLNKTIKNYNLRLHAFVLMSNHFHLMLSTPDANISAAMRYFMTETSRRIGKASQRINKIYGSRYSWTIIRHSAHYAHALRYVYYNPVKAGLVICAQEYPWSTLGSRDTKFLSLITENENGFDEMVPPDRTELLMWLNEAVDTDYLEAVGKALRRREFRFVSHRRTGRKCEYLDQLHSQ